VTNEIINPGVVELELKELTKEQLIAQVLRLQHMLEHRPDAELRKRKAELEIECYNNGWVLAKICDYLNARGYKTPETLTIHKVVFQALYDVEHKNKDLL